MYNIHAPSSYQFPCDEWEIKGKRIFCRFYILNPSSLLILLYILKLNNISNGLLEDKCPSLPVIIFVLFNLQLQ